MLKEFIALLRDLNQKGADLNRFYEVTEKVIAYDHDQAKIALDKVYERATASTEKLAAAQS